MIRRKESWKQYGLLAKHLLPTIIQTATICLPLLLFLISKGQIHSYLPFQSILTTKEILTSPFPTNVLGFLLTALVWGFWEGFNYVVIANKINCRFPSHQTWLDYGALTCALICLMIHWDDQFSSPCHFRGFVCFYLDLWYARHSKENRQRLGLYFYLPIHLERILTPKQDFHFLNSKKDLTLKSQIFFY